MNGFKRILILAFLVISAGCQQKSGKVDDPETSKGGENIDNQVLYNEVMKVHDEVMPKMDDLYKAKVALNKKITNTPTIGEKEKTEIQNKIKRLDAASEGMMIWMRQFNPMPDSLGEDKARDYLENEMKKVKKVKEDILQALETTQSNTP